MWPLRRKPEHADRVDDPLRAASPVRKADGALGSECAAARLGSAERKALLTVARASARRALDPSAPDSTPRVEIPGRFGGVFVTIWNGSNLRGCIGTFQPTADLGATVIDVTRSALGDPRFVSDPVMLDELPELTFEVSVLSDLERTNDPLSLVPGTHGVLIRRGQQSGCFLPKVATDRGWNIEEFLSNCCTMKAKLPADAWRDADTEVSPFTVESFGDDLH